MPCVGHIHIEVTMSWSELPDIEDVRTALNDLIIAKFNLRMDELRLSILQAQIAQKSPRNAAAKVVGTNEEERLELLQLQTAIIERKEQVEQLESDVDFNDTRVDVYKALAYKGRV